MEANGSKLISSVTGRKIVFSIIFLYCAVILGSVIWVMLCLYDPTLNSLGALGSACMDIICILILLIIVLSLCLERGEHKRTAKFCMGLMLATLWALFFDFLTWSLDGTLVYDGWTDVFTIASLCSGAIIGGIFVCYLSSYLNDMYGIKVYIGSKICFFCNLAAFILTIMMGITNTAFVFVNGHYETTALYYVITILPILTLIYMAIYVIRHSKIIGVHDVIAVVVYIFVMITGAIIEAIYGIGATYVSVTVADVFIFVMLQNKLIDRTRKQSDLLSEEITSQFDILKSMAGIYSYVDYIDFDEQIVKRFDAKDTLDTLDMSNPHTAVNRSLYDNISDEMKDKFWEFTNFATLTHRMRGTKSITAEFLHNTDGWIRTQYIRIGDSPNSPIRKVIYTIRNIDKEKKNVEKWIQRSNTDEVTGLYNRHAYEEEIASLEKKKIKDDFVYISMDVNGLKVVNDTLGHEAGDELIVGACTCMRRCFEEFGKIFRIGGDEFVALIYADENQFSELRDEFAELTSSWSGNLNDGLAVSYGFVTGKEAGQMSLHQMAVLADKRMYESKTKYYRKKGIDRRGQKDVLVALSSLYAQILKINITDDTYQVETSKQSNIEFGGKITSWLKEYSPSELIHPDDLPLYLEKTNIDYMSNYFRNNTAPLRIVFRKKCETEYKQIMMEIVPASDYTNDAQNLFLYVKCMD